MNDRVLSRMAAAQDALLAALDVRNVGAIEEAGRLLLAAIEEVRTVGGWRGRDDLRDAVLKALETANAVRARLNVLADRNRRRLDRLAAVAGEPRKMAYSRNGTLG